MSRWGKIREGEESTGAYENITMVKGNCLVIDSFESLLTDVDAVVHTVGTLIEKKGTPESSYEEKNRDSCDNVASVLQKFAEKKKETRNFVMISAAKAPFFLPKYITTKEEAEHNLINCPNLNPTIIKAGLIVDGDHRWWSVPAKEVNDFIYNL